MKEGKIVNNIYLDHAATTPMAAEVIEAMMVAMKEDFGNPSSTHLFGRESKGEINKAREVFAKSINAQISEIVFTSGGTESDNTAIIKTAESRADEGKHLITTNVEHEAVLKSMTYLESKGFEVTYLPVDEKGRITAKQVEEAIRPDTTLVSIMYVNNEVGNIMPIKEIGEIVADSNAFFHTDAVQAYGLLDIDVEAEQIDLLSVSSHKLYGPKGVGFLYKREGVNFDSFVHGGEQENKRRAGTENTPGIVGFKKAVELAVENKEERRSHVLELRNYTIQALKEAGVDFSVNGDSEHTVGHILNFRINDVPSEQLLIQLDLNGMGVSAGSACTAGNIDPSHVLLAMFAEDAPEITETLRFSFGKDNTKEDIDEVVPVIKKAQNKKRQ